MTEPAPPAAGPPAAGPPAAGPPAALAGADAGATPGARRRLAARWASVPLRTRLLATLLVLLGCVSAGVIAVSELGLQRFLVDRLDASLTQAEGRTRTQLGGVPPGIAAPGVSGAGGGSADSEGGGVRFLLGPGTAAGTLGVRVRNGAVDSAGVLGATGTTQPLNLDAVAALVAVRNDGEPHTIHLDDHGSYRVVATSAPDGDQIIVGLPLAPVHETVVRLLIIELAVTGVGLLAAGTGGALLVGASLRPLRRVAATARAVTALELDRGEVALAARVPAADTDPHTEVGQVGAALNAMLGHVSAALTARQASETRVRQFVADASHELRTPLAAIRGYAELTRRSDEPVPDGVAHALRRVESEAARMTSLVQDLLLLARLDSGRPLAAEPVDLRRLVADVVSDAHVAGPEHRWVMQLPDTELLVVGDASRLHQVLANLLANARVHTPPGTTVTTALRADDPGSDRPGVLLTVVDDGPGIPAALLPTVFERFARGDSSRSRAAGSTGLGLAIVAAVVAAHGGSVAVSSAPGRTAFRVRLPVAPAAVAGTDVAQPPAVTAPGAPVPAAADVDAAATAAATPG